MITSAKMIRTARKGGTVTHLALSGDVPSLCGRMAFEEAGNARLCKSCARIAHVADSEGEWTEAEEHFIALPREAGQWEMLSDVVSDYDKGAENSPSRIALYRAALARRNYTTTTITNHSDARTRNSDGNVIGGGKVKKTRKGASEGQITFILSLISQISEFDSELGRNHAKICTPEYLADLPWNGEHTVSDVIDELKADLLTVRILAPKMEIKTSSGIKEDEIFVLNGEYYKTKKSKAGHLYAMHWDGGSWDYDSAKGVIRKLTPEMRATAAQAAEFGHTYHCCVFCSRALTDSRSETVGYGPKCADDRGLPWGE